MGTTLSQMRRAANTNLLFWVNMHFFKFKISPLDIMDIFWNLWEASMPNSVDLMGDWGCLEVLSLWALYDIEFDLLLMAFFLSIEIFGLYLYISTICSRLVFQRFPSFCVDRNDGNCWNTSPSILTFSYFHFQCFYLLFFLKEI